MWMENYRQFWDEGFDKLDTALANSTSTQEDILAADNSQTNTEKGTGK